jgi:hypothetical protein
MIRYSAMRRTQWAMRLTLYALLIAHCAVLAPNAWAIGNSQVGTSRASFLKIGPGARPEGMGEAYTGLADDIDAIYYNPAGLATIKSPELIGMHMQWFQSIQYEYAAFAYPTQNHGTWGFAVTDLHTNNIDARTGDTDAPDGQFSAIEGAYWLSYANHVTDKLSLGANAKFIRETIDTTNANAYAADGGALYETGWKGVKLGASVQNIGTQVKLVNEADPLPLLVRAGGSIPLREANAPSVLRNMVLSSDIIIPRDHQVGLDLGGEYVGHLRDGFGYSLRSGYQTANTDVSGLSGVSMGGGLIIGRMNVDFAWVPFGDLGNTYRLSLHLKFGPAGEDLNAPAQMKQASAGPLSSQGRLADKSDSDAALEQLLSL